MHDIAGELPAIAVPSLVIHGREDMLIPHSEAETLATLLAGARLESFADTGHMPMVERAVPFNEALLRFVGAL
jgi:pimeloyl-ACP methyl ester carboxylesterase